MNVVCKFQGCPFRSASNFCRRRLVAIGRNGVCTYLVKQINRGRAPLDFEYQGWSKKNDDFRGNN